MACRELRRADEPVNRLIGFTCNCSGREEMWQIPLTEVRRMGDEWMRVINALRECEYEENWEHRRNLFGVGDEEPLHADWNHRIGPGFVNMAGLERLELAGLERVKRESRKQRVARRKAGILLHRHVTDSQWEEFRRKKHIHVTGSDGRLYRIDKKLGSSVTLIVDGKDVARYCLVPKGHTWIPEADMMLAIKLMLETDALAFTKKANFFELNSRPVRVEQDGREVMLRLNEHGALVEVQPEAPAEPVEEECQPRMPPIAQRRLRRAG